MIVNNKPRYALRLTHALAESFIASIQGIRHRNRVHVFWSRGFSQGYSNFGDLLSPALFRHYGMTPVWCPPKMARIVGLGSILQSVAADYSGYVIGSGLIADIHHPLPRAKVLAVRGALSRERIGALAETPLGDPGLLAEKLVPRRQKKQFLLGIVVHYADGNDPRIGRYKTNERDRVTVIDVQQCPQVVISQIDACEHILSSSLHGVIVADALGIPSGWMLLSDKVAGDGFKFRDYGSCLNQNIQPHVLHDDLTIKELVEMTQPAPRIVESRKQELDEIFQSLAKRLGKPR